jgi:hypothetical protein
MSGGGVVLPMSRTGTDSDAVVSGASGGRAGSTVRDGASAIADEQSDSGSVDLSVVVVTRDEATRIEACLDAVFRACRDGPSFEVILVDSNSADGTVPRARRYPITVLRIPSDDLSTPGAGRYVGTRVASGDRLLFVDGDVVLDESWLGRALSFLRTHPDVAGVDGYLDDPPDHDEVRTVSCVHGVALYDAAAVRSVGSYHPFLQSVEDIHLGYELTAAGYRLCRLPVVSASHPDRGGPLELLRRWRNGYSIGSGQALRLSATSPRLPARHLRRTRSSRGSQSASPRRRPLLASRRGSPCRPWALPSPSPGAARSEPSTGSRAN